MIEYSYAKAPYFKEIYPLIKKVLQSEEVILPKYIHNSFLVFCDYLNIETDFVYSSELKKDNSKKGQEKIISICELLNANEYYNPIGGQQLYSAELFQSKNISLKFLKPNSIIYKQFGEDFQDNLSIIDVMMFNSREEVLNLLKQYTLV